MNVKQPYINADGVEIKLSQDDLNKIQELADYYTTVAGQDFTVRKINQAETGVEPPKHIEVSSSTTKAVTVKNLINDLKTEYSKTKRGQNLLADLEDIEYKLDKCTDDILLGQIEKELKATLELVLGNPNDVTDITLTNVSRYLDAYNSAIGNYEMLYNIDGGAVDKRAYFRFKKNKLNDSEFVNRAERSANANDIKDAEINDFNDAGRFAGIIDLCENSRTSDPEIVKYLYENYYLKQADISPELASACLDISSNFGTKIFLSHQNIENAPKALEIINKEFSEWQSKSNGTATLPQVLNFNSTKREYIDTGAVNGQGAAGGLASGKNISLNSYTDRDGMSFAAGLRHEITHLNDKRKGFIFSDEYNSCEICSNETYESGRFREEFERAGISEKYIKYAHTNSLEFIAVAAQGDMTKYSPEFKKMLVEFGMPEYMFEMKKFDETLTNIPKGLTSEEDALIQQARTENPADVVADKVKQQWMEDGLHTSVEDEPVDLFNLDPNAGLRQPAPEVNGEVTSLIFTGKLKDVLTKRYDEMGRVFNDIAQKRSADFKKLAQECGNDKQAFANGVIAILAEEMGMKGLEPKIELINTEGKADGLADWTTGTIQINEYTSNAKKIVEIISHEFAHMLQYRDVLAQYGEQGLREIVMNDKSIPANQKEATIRKVLDSDYTKNLLDNFNELQHSETGSLNEYITRIYKDEFANPVDPDVDMQGYVDQVTEREAYNLGSERLGNNTQELDQFELNDDWTREQGFTIHESSNGVKFKVYDDGTIERINSNAPKGVVSNTPTTELTFADFSDINKINELIMNTLKENATYLTDGTQRVSGYLNKNLANIIEVLPDDTPQAVIDKLVELSNNPKATVYDAIKEIHTLATSTQKLPVDITARKTLASLYDEIIANAKKDGNTRRVGIYAQSKNNIDQLRIEDVYFNLLTMLYRESRLADYSMSTVDIDINNVTSKDNSLIKVRDENGWFYRMPRRRTTTQTVDRISINALAEPNLIKALDDLLGNGEVRGYYKTPNTPSDWASRHDPITIYLDEKATPEILEKVRSVCKKYIRSTDDVLIGDKFAPGFALQKSPSTIDIENLLKKANIIDPVLEKTLRKYFTNDGKLKASAGELSAAEKLLEYLQ